MKILQWNTLSKNEKQNALERPAISQSDRIAAAVTNVINEVKQNGDQALNALTQKFDQVSLDSIQVSDDDVSAACARLSQGLKAALDQAYANIFTFHQAQVPEPLSVETMSGIHCELITRPINRVGL